MTTTNRQRTTALVIGGGIAGCTAAIGLADAGLDVTLLVSTDDMDGGNSALAQGGIIHRAGAKDSALLEQDLLVAGSFHNYVSAVKRLCKEGPNAIEEVLLERAPVPFDRDANGHLAYTREGGHSTARIVHCKDHTGKSIMQALLQAVRTTPNITVLTNRTAVELITSAKHPRNMSYRYRVDNQCLGAYVFDNGTQSMQTMLADWTVLATGGVGQVYAHTSNRPEANGSGLAMAQRAGARLENMAYVQFHPTALCHGGPRCFLITEALRGEGARLVDHTGRAFMQDYDSRKDLAPRDIVSRSISTEMQKQHLDSVYLDLSDVPHNLAQRFPTIYKYCQELGIDIEKEPIPVVPVAHYLCGGILTTMQGRSSLKRLYAVGECACTGVHGANRLASASLLEGLLWGASAAKDIAARHSTRSSLGKNLMASIPDWEVENGTLLDPADVEQGWKQIRSTMWQHVGIVRSKKGLQQAVADLDALDRRLYEQASICADRQGIALAHGCRAALLIASAALNTPKSLGCHFRTDG